MASPPRPPAAPPVSNVASQTSAPPLGKHEEDATPPPGETRGKPGHLGTLRLAPLMDVGLPRLTLVVESEAGKPAQRTVVHEGDVCRIGTHPSNDVVLEDATVSRFHCRLVPDAMGWRVEDLGSLNGTKLQDLVIHGAVLPKEAVLTLGQTAIRVSATEIGKALVPQQQGFGSLSGTSRAMQKLFALVEKVAASEINCLVTGESGSGKELVATEVVQRGARADKPFVVVDCGAISPSLVESELFGHVRGAFTGADRDRVGAFEAADGGTVFLDEIGELPLEVQPKLLRALEQREIRRVGETRTRKVNVRVISATNRDLEREVNKGTFRGDLYFRLAVITVRVPALRERVEDLPLLIKTFLASLGAEDSEHLFPKEVIDELAMHAWPGNVRELRNYVERSVVLQTARMSLTGQNRTVTGSRPPPASGADVDPNIPFKVAKDALVEAFERAYVRAVLEACGGNLTKAARMAGIDRMYLHRLVQKHGTREEMGK